MAFDLASYRKEALNTADVAINHPVTGEPTGIVITVLSMDSDEYRKASLKLQNENIKFIRKNRGKTTAERIAEENLALLAAATVGWSGIEENGQPLPFNTENARRVYSDFPFIKEQVDEFIGDRRNFIRG